jgi:hypothetical protein
MYGGFIGIMAGTFNAAVSVMIMYFMMRLTGEDTRDYTFDDLKVRYKRIRQQCLEQLKDSSLLADTIKTLITDIKHIDDIILQATDYKPVCAALSNLIFPANRNSKRAIEQQQLIEDLAHNDLFLKSAELKTLH